MASGGGGRTINTASGRGASYQPTRASAASSQAAAVKAAASAAASKNVFNNLTPQTMASGAAPPTWTDVFNAFNTQHKAVYGKVINRPWNSDQDSQNAKLAIDNLYKQGLDSWNKAHNQNIPVDNRFLGVNVQPNSYTPDKSQGLDPFAVIGGLALSFLLPGVGSAIAAELVGAGVIAAGATADALGLAIASTASQVAQGKSFEDALKNSIVNVAVNTGSIEAAKAVNTVINNPAVTNAIVSASSSAVKSAASGGSEDDAAKAALAGLVSSGTTSAVKNALDVSPNAANIIGAGAGGAVTGGTTGAITSALNTAASQLGTSTLTPTPTPTSTPSSTSTSAAATTDLVADINQIIEKGTSGIQTAGALPLASYYSESAFKNAEPILRKVVEAANDPNYKVLMPKIEEALGRMGVTVSELASRLAPATLAATLMTYSPNAGDPNEIANVAEKFKTFTGFDPTETLKTEAPKITQPKRPITPTPVASSNVAKPTTSTQPPLKDAPLLDLIAQQPVVPQATTEVTAETPPAPVTSPDREILDLIAPTPTATPKAAPYTPNISVFSPFPEAAPRTVPEFVPKDVTKGPDSSFVSPVLVTPETTTKTTPETPVPVTDDKKILNLIASDSQPTSISKPTTTTEPTSTPASTDASKEEVPADTSKAKVPADKEKLYKPKIITKTVVTPTKPESSVLSQALGTTTGLTASRGAGEIEDPSTGKKRKKVWNEETLRLKDALGV